MFRRQSALNGLYFTSVIILVIKLYNTKGLSQSIILICDSPFFCTAIIFYIIKYYLTFLLPEIEEPIISTALSLTITLPYSQILENVSAPPDILSPNSPIISV